MCFADVNDFDSYGEFMLKVQGIVREKGLNVLINNAGVMKGKKDSLSEYNVKDMMDTLTTNFIAPVMLIKVKYCFAFMFVAFSVYSIQTYL